MSENHRLIANAKYTKYTQLINKAQDDEAICYFYLTHAVKHALCVLLTILSLGTLLLLFYWKPAWRVYLSSSLCEPTNADTVILQDSYKNYTVAKIQTIRRSVNRECSSRDSYQSLDGQASSNLDRIENHVQDKKPNDKYFQFRSLRYVWNGESMLYERLTGLDHSTTCVRIVSDFKGYSVDKQNDKLRYFGLNSIEVEVKSYARLFVEEVLTPFYIFQIMACTLWLIDDYVLYAICIIVISLISTIMSLIETKRQAKTLHEMVKTHLTVHVSRGGDDFEEVATEYLVPGDVIAIPSNHETTMACDAVLLNGTCVVNESMLTGESVPVIKTPLPYPEDLNEIYDVEVHKRNTLFNGTRVVQTRNYEGGRVLAVVIRTGFSTSKGDLVRSILFPKPTGFKFYQDSLKFILFLFFIAVIGMSYGIVVLVTKKVDTWDIVIRALDIITIVVPPALPAAMTVGTVYAQSRLKKRSIYCISPPRINVGGKLKLICFDKTGTLTEDGLDLWGITEANVQKTFNQPIHNIMELENGPMLYSLATCHSLTKYNGALTGDPLDVKMFESTEWTFIDEHAAGACKFEQTAPVVRQTSQQNSDSQSPAEIAIVKQFTFSSQLLRMSVLCKTLGSDHMDVYTKGAPEKIIEMCKPNTVPENFNDLLQVYTANGFRVIAMAGKSIDSSVSWIQACKLTRDVIESDLTFYGFLIMQNTIKPETIPVIEELTKAGLRSVMVTGDNLLTALCVARKCGMVPKTNKVVLIEAEPSGNEHTNGARIEWRVANDSSEVENDDFNANQSSYQNCQTIVKMHGNDGTYNFAMTGKTFAVLKKSFPDVLRKILINGTIFARMSPDQKAQLVEQFIAIDYCVSMCGDGANDCGALKAAHVGISLSEAEASVAAPFTSKIQNISCVPQVIKEGRAALVTSFGVFKYMALYSMIQFTSVLLLYTFMTNLADPQFLYVDLFLITPVAVFMSANKAYEQIAVKRPLGSLVGFVNVCSIIFQIVLVGLFQTGLVAFLRMQSWYEESKANPHDFKQNNKTMEGTTVFLFSTFQYVIMAVVYSKGPPYRQKISQNVVFLVALAFLTACNIWITLCPIKEVDYLLSMNSLDKTNTISMFRVSIVELAFVFFVISYVTEELIVDSKWFKRLGKVIVRKKQPKNKYKLIQQEVEKDSQWPYIGQVTIENGTLRS